MKKITLTKHDESPQADPQAWQTVRQNQTMPTATCTEIKPFL